MSSKLSFPTQNSKLKTHNSLLLSFFYNYCYVARSLEYWRGHTAGASTEALEDRTLIGKYTLDVEVFGGHLEVVLGVGCRAPDNVQYLFRSAMRQEPQDGDGFVYALAPNCIHYQSHLPGRATYVLRYCSNFHL